MELLTSAFVKMEATSWACKISDNFEVARAKFMPMMQEFLGSGTVIISAGVKNAVDRGHFLENQYVGVFSNNIMYKRDELQALCDVYGMFCVMPEESNVVHIWLPTYWDPMGRRNCASFMHDKEELIKVMGEGVDRLWGARVPVYNTASFGTLKAHVTKEVLKLLPPVEQTNFSC